MNEIQDWLSIGILMESLSRLSIITLDIFTFFGTLIKVK